MFDIIDIIKIITRKNNLHVCIQPTDKGIILPYEYFTHSKPFCNLAKSTDEGLKLCFENKAKAIDKALKGQEYSGYCACGLFEFVRPVFINDKIRYIIYVGNILNDKATACDKVDKLCERTKASKEKLKEELLNAEPFSTKEEYQKILDLLEFHVRRFHEASKHNQSPNSTFIVDLLKDFIEKNYDKNFLISDFAKTHRVNAKYLGRLFKAQQGVSATEYLNAYRLEKASTLMLTTDLKIIEIAMQVGFFNIGYFNRAFKQKFGVTPKEYRTKNRS